MLITFSTLYLLCCRFSKNDESQSPKSQKTWMQIRQEKEIQRLEKEIEQLNTLVHRRKELLNKHYEKTHYPDKSAKTVDDYRDECEDMKNQIELTTKISGITIEEFDCDRLKSGDIIQCALTGCCHDTRFKIEFECVEKKLPNENNETLQIIKLDIYVPEDVEEELQRILVSLSETCFIWGFFQLLVSYSLWHQQRNETFIHFTKKYPDFVETVEESFSPYLIIQNSKHNQSPVFCINWKFEIDQCYRAIPKLTLGMKVPSYMVNQDRDSALDETIERFEDIIEELGIEGAIETVISLAAC